MPQDRSAQDDDRSAAPHVHRHGHAPMHPVPALIPFTGHATIIDAQNLHCGGEKTIARSRAMLWYANALLRNEQAVPYNAPTRGQGDAVRFSAPSEKRRFADELLLSSGGMQREACSALRRARHEAVDRRNPAC